MGSDLSYMHEQQEKQQRERERLYTRKMYPFYEGRFKSKKVFAAHLAAEQHRRTPENS